MPLGLLLTAAVLLVTPVLPAAAELPVPRPPDRRINDFAGALSAAEREGLERTLVQRERESTNQVVVAIFRSLRGEDLEDYSIRLAQAWRIGQKGLDNGVILLVFLDDRRMRIEVGYGLEPVLTDAVASSIIRDVMAPRFREGRLADGIAAGLDAIAEAIAGTYRAPDRRASGPRVPVSAQGRLAVVLLLAVALGVILPAVALAMAAQNRRRGWTGGRRGWMVGPHVGGSGWSRGGGFGSGGFSGGGGGFGGGGASGRW